MAGRKNSAGMELAIGVAIVAAVIIIATMILAWGDQSSLFSKHYKVVAVMDNIGGLREGTPVKIGGFRIGRVSQIQFRPGETRLEIVMDIDNNRSIPDKSSVKIATAGLVGDAYLEIIPSSMTESVPRVLTADKAARLESQPPADINDILLMATRIGGQVSVMAENINDILGDGKFRNNIRSLAANLDAGTYEANLLLQRSHKIVDNINATIENVQALSLTLRANVEKVSSNVADFTDKAKVVADKAVELADKAKGVADSAKTTIENIDGGVTEVRQDLAKTLGDPEVVAHFKQLMKNADDTLATMAANRTKISAVIDNVTQVSEGLKETAAKVKSISDQINPGDVKDAMDKVKAGIYVVSDMVEKIKNDPVLALSINKAADRVVKAKFDELAKQNLTRSAEDMLKAVRAWVSESMQQGYFNDPSYEYQKRPYNMQ